jgi:hypothetical protein
LDIFKRVANERVTLQINGKAIRMSRADAVLYVNQQRALENDNRAMRNIISVIEASRLMEQLPADSPAIPTIAVPRVAKSPEEFNEIVKRRAQR